MPSPSTGSLPRITCVPEDLGKILTLTWGLACENITVTYGSAVIKSQSSLHPWPSVSMQLITLFIRCHRLFVRVQKQIGNGWGCHLFIKVRQMKLWLLPTSLACHELAPIRAHSSCSFLPTPSKREETLLSSGHELHCTQPGAFSLNSTAAPLPNPPSMILMPL